MPKPNRRWFRSFLRIMPGRESKWACDGFDLFTIVVLAILSLPMFEGGASIWVAAALLVLLVLFLTSDLSPFARRRRNRCVYCGRKLSSENLQVCECRPDAENTPPSQGGSPPMPTPDSPPPWYQFNLRTLFVAGLFVAALCSLGVCTHWLVSIAIGFGVMLGGTVGRIVAGTRLGFVQGAVNGSVFSLAQVLFFVIIPMSGPPSWRVWVGLGIAVVVGALVGGYVGGRIARFALLPPPPICLSRRRKSER